MSGASKLNGASSWNSAKIFSPPAHAFAPRQKRLPKSTAGIFRPTGSGAATCARSWRLGVLETVAARHPVVEWRMETAGQTSSFPKTSMSKRRPQPAALTGPNMGGKSTYLRQAALLVIMAQMGCFVPAKSMRLGIGGSHLYPHRRQRQRGPRAFYLYGGNDGNGDHSCNTATPQSLMLLDEMGRGTATFDGLSLAWATVEHIHEILSQEHFSQPITMSSHCWPEFARTEKLARRPSRKIPRALSFCTPSRQARRTRATELTWLVWPAFRPVMVVRAREILRQHEQSEKRETSPAANR